MATHKCIQEIPINTLQLKQEQMAKDISEIKDDVKLIKDFMYSMEEKFAKKEELEKVKDKIDNVRVYIWLAIGWGGVIVWLATQVIQYISNKP